MTGEQGTLSPEAVAFGPDGLIAAVVQDASDGRVLMVAWQDREALEATLATGEVHFHSRSRGTLWRKGETSGNVLRLRRAELDCDADAILLTVDPTGPACHTGVRSCFDVGASIDAETGSAAKPVEPTANTAAAPQGFGWLDTLWSTIQQRAADRPAGSYTTRLLDGGVDAVSRKVAEEAVEVVMAAKDHAVTPDDATQTALVSELADLVYHSLVLMAERGLTPADIVHVLRDRASGPTRVGG
jgi:phosphoribosyl-ATP pyrophosphohydrolase/phosphoribosyl-AMP cyclohydrolase